MPVKNTKRRTNDGLEGVIAGLTEEEKKVLEDAGIGGGTAVEANPQEEATQQLEKIKIDNITYSTAGGNTIIFKSQSIFPPEKSYWTDNNNENLNKLNKAVEKGMNIAIYCYSPYETSTKQPYTIYTLGGYEGFGPSKIVFVQDKLHPDSGAGIGDSSGNPSKPYYEYYNVDPETGNTYHGYQLINTLAMGVGNAVGVNKNGEFLRVGNNSTGNSGYLGIPNKKGRDLTEGTYSYKLTVDSSGNRTYDWVKDA